MPRSLKIENRIYCLLLANRKTPQEFLELVATSPFSLFDIKQAFEEVQDYKLLEFCIALASRNNLGVVEAAIEVQMRKRMVAITAVEASKTMPWIEDEKLETIG